MSFLYILDTFVRYVVKNIFFLPVDCLFIFLTMSFTKEKFWIFINSNFLDFWLHIYEFFAWP